MERMEFSQPGPSSATNPADAVQELYVRLLEKAEAAGGEEWLRRCLSLSLTGESSSAVAGEAPSLGAASGTASPGPEVAPSPVSDVGVARAGSDAGAVPVTGGDPGPVPAAPVVERRSKRQASRQRKRYAPTVASGGRGPGDRGRQSGQRRRDGRGHQSVATQRQPAAVGGSSVGPAAPTPPARDASAGSSALRRSAPPLGAGRELVSFHPPVNPGSLPPVLPVADTSAEPAMGECSNAGHSAQAGMDALNNLPGSQLLSGMAALFNMLAAIPGNNTGAVKANAGQSCAAAWVNPPTASGGDPARSSSVSSQLSSASVLDVANSVVSATNESPVSVVATVTNPSVSKQDVASVSSVSNIPVMSQSVPEICLKEAITCEVSPLGYHLALSVKEKNLER
ncbi:transcription initiation factor TFIID subunit 4-like [Hyla sarda]|uniref:transcription initiation factor TFIID subunit 4-like n=1 Tax=Hyla sarda TaxID=327740 RepID=UPI0024C4317A|nr:transcription initiation factor TFIID subunit 4-like [Hyla sarda]